MLDALIAYEFPVNRHLLYLNHAAVAPWPTRTRDAVNAFADDCNTIGARDYPKWVETEARLREQCRQLIGADSVNDIALVKNTSEALSMVAQGFLWEAGDNVVISDQEFPSNRIVWEALATQGVGVRQIALDVDASPEEALIKACDRRTRLLAISSVQYATGLRVDLEQLGQACRARGIAFCVDAIQGLGVTPHDVDAMHIDFLMADGHKWMLGPEGLGVFYCRETWRDRLRLFEYGWHMVEDYLNYDRRDWSPAASARRFECGSQNMLGIHALSASLSLVLEVGVARIERAVLDRAELLFDAISARNDLTLITRPTPGRYAGIVTFSHRNKPAGELFARLKSNGVVCALRGGGVRLSPHFYTDIEALRGVVAID